jgi:nitrogen fixation/metabolism regulation signal transduction histidine kinase
VKQYSLQTVLNMLLLAAFSTGACLLYLQQLWFSALVVSLLAVGSAVRLYKQQMIHIGIMRQLIDSIRFNDMTQTFSVSVKNKMMRELAEELAGVSKDFRKRLLEEEIKRRYYENLLNKVDTAVLVVDTDGRIEWMNHPATTFWGQKPYLPEMLLISPVDETRVVNLEKDGVSWEMAVSSTSFFSQGKEQLLISLKNIHSVLEQNETEAWQKLIRILTHEIMNSITPVISLSETLSERNVSSQPSNKEYKVLLQAMQTIHRRSKGLLNFVENYRRLTRIPAPVYTQVSVRELFSDLQKFFPEKEIRIESPNPDVWLTIDRAQIEQVLINLLKNAKEACMKKPNPLIEMKITDRKQSGQATLIVQDNGKGILPEVMDKIFVPFFTTKPTGSGIGLSLCKQIMTRHGGSISVSSLSGEGSCFRLKFNRITETNHPDTVI